MQHHITLQNSIRAVICPDILFGNREQGNLEIKRRIMLPAGEPIVCDLYSQPWGF